MSIRALPLAALPLIVAGLAACEKVEQPEPIPKLTYVDDVAPILEKHCVQCHVPGLQGAVESGLLMDSYESLMQGSRFGPVVNPGSAMTSSLYILVAGKGRLTVSMPHGSDPLSTEEVETIRTWIDNGAVEN